jgi:alpha,alpha-trehalose phosphorylase
MSGASFDSGRAFHAALRQQARHRSRSLRRSPVRPRRRDNQHGEAIIAAQIGDMEKAIRYGMAALLMDLADVGGNVKDGCHIASMGGTWMMLAYGFGGMRDHDGTLSFWPRRAPEENAVLRFPVTYQGKLLEVQTGLESVEYVLREGDRLLIRHETENIELTREKPVAVRPVSKR